MAAAKRNPDRCPTHPGELLREDVLPALNMSKTDIADALGMSLVHTNKTINKLRRMGVFDLSHGLLTLQNLGVLERIAQAFETEIAPRPLI